MPAVIPTLPDNAPFTAEQRAWLNGYLAGLLHDHAAAAPAATAEAPRPTAPLLIAFGSQGGTAAGLARRIAREASNHGFEAAVQELNALTLATLAREPRVLLVTSTWGDGDAPDNATSFWSALADPAAPALTGLAFAVLGLGDRNYSDFCGAARKFDERLVALGARRLLPRAECDVDYEAPARAWLESFWPVLGSQNGGTSYSSPPSTVEAHENAPPPLLLSPDVAAPGNPTPSPPAVWDRNRPFPAHLKTNRRLNASGSSKDTRHFEILLADSGLAYQAGDALGIVPQNCPALVEELLALLGMSGDEAVPYPGGGPVSVGRGSARAVPGSDPTGATGSLHDLLLQRVVITQAPPNFVREAATRSPGSVPAGPPGPERKAELDAWLHGRDVVDVLRACPGARFEPTELSGLLRKLQPRLYSISSSPKAHPGEVHLTVGAVRYEAHGRMRRGVASCWLADRVLPGETAVPLFVQTSHGFRLPVDGRVPVIMVGPGTGIAPFRAFLEERRAMGATGRNWLFFGDHRRGHDFLYADELEPLHADGFLTRLDLAFSRDQEAKLYVQHRMEENAGELWRWLEDGAHFYVCGDAQRMAKDVDAALRRVVSSAGDRTVEQAVAYVTALKAAKRYQRDVY